MVQLKFAKNFNEVRVPKERKNRAVKMPLSLGISRLVINGHMEYMNII